MSLVNPANWDQLGYKKLGPKNINEQANTKGLAGVMKDHHLWDVIETGGEYWVRDYARIKGRNKPLLLERVGHITPENVSDSKTHDFAREYAKSEYSDALRRQRTNWEQAIQTVEAIRNLDEPWRGAYRFTGVITLMDPDLLASFLKNHAMPKFFEVYPKGEIIAYKTTFNYGYRFSVIRVGYTVQQYSISEINTANIRTCETLRFWHAFDPHLQPSTLISLASILLYPQITHIESGPLGLVLVFIFDKSEKQQHKNFPSSWLDIAKSESLFGQQDLDIAKFFSDPASDEAELMKHRRYLCKATFNTGDVLTFLQWLIDRYNSLTFHLTDPCEFESNGYIDFVWAFEQNLTFDRVLRIALSCICSEEAANRKSMVFELADLIEELRRLWSTKSNSGDWFKELFHPQNGLLLVKSCFEHTPQPFKEQLLKIAEECYSELLEVTKSSVWVRTKVSASGVMVKDRNLRNEREETWPDFTANLMRAYRNTHHGYLTSSDPFNRPSRYLALVNGNVPDSVSMLGPLWAIALIADPEKMIGWQPLPVSFYD